MNELFHRFLWIAMVVVMGFYTRFVIESANEHSVESMATIKSEHSADETTLEREEEEEETDEEYETDDVTAEIKRKMAEADQIDKTRELLKQKADVANQAAEKWSPIMFFIRIYMAIYNGLLEFQKWVNGLFRDMGELFGIYAKQYTVISV